MFGFPPLEADLSGYTAEEIELAQKMHDETCTKSCDWGAFKSIMDPYSWLDLARERLKRDNPQNERLF